MPLLERDDALASLVEYTREASVGDGRLVVIAGEAGSGKTAVVRAFQERVNAARWWEAACDGLFTPRPLGPLRDLATQLGGALAAAVAESAPREQMFVAFLDELDRSDLATVVVFEDIHWADEATLDLIYFLGRRIASRRCLFVVTHRDDGLAPGDPLRVTLGRLASERSIRRLGVPPLTEAAVGLMAAGQPLDPREVHRLTGGNAFLVSELIQSGSTELPRSARDAVHARLDPLDDQTREMAQAAALLGTHVDLELLARVVGTDLSALDGLVASGVLTTDGHRLRFRHELTRQAVADEISAHRVGPLHRRILGALEERGLADDARMAFHAEGARDTQAVLLHAPAAGRAAAALSAHREAAAQFERALRFTDGESQDAVAVLLEDFATEAKLVDRWDEALQARTQALELWRSVGDPLRIGNTLRVLSRMLAGRAGLERSLEALSILEPLGPSEELAWVRSTHAAILENCGESDAALEWAAGAITLAGELGLDAVHSDALDTQACAKATLGRNWFNDLERAMALGKQSGAVEQTARAYTNLVEIPFEQLEFAAAERWLAEAAAYCEDHDIASYGYCLQCSAVRLMELRGRWDDAARRCSQLLNVAGSPENRIAPHAILGLILARRGQQSPWQHLDQALADAHTSDDPAWLRFAHLCRAEASWLAGKDDAAAASVRSATVLRGRVHPMVASSQARWAHRVGVSDPAPGVALHAATRLELQGDSAQAARGWLDLGCPYEAALVRLTSDDEVQVRLGSEAMNALGALAAAEGGRLRLRKLGGGSVPSGPRSATRADPLGLTPRERQVLDLVSDGLTNADIAARLVLSVRTVEHHVSAVLTKLGVSTRTAAGRAGLQEAERH